MTTPTIEIPDWLWLDQGGHDTGDGDKCALCVEEVLAVMVDPNAFGLQSRLPDPFGDDGIIALIIGRKA